MAEKGRIKIVLDLVDKKLRAGLSKTKAVMGGFAKATAIAFAAAAAAVAVFTVALSKAIAAANIQILAEEKLAGTLKATIGASKAETKALLVQASALQKVTRFGDETILASQQQIAIYGLSIKAIKALTPRMLDMAEANIDTATASRLLGMAMTGNTSLLTRYGIVFDDATKKILAMGTEEEKIIALTEALDAKFGGLAETVGKTFFGATERAKNALGDIWEEIGKTISQSTAAKAAVLTFAKGFETLSKKISDGVSENQGLVKSFVLGIINGIGFAISVVFGLAKAWTSVQAALSDAINLTVWILKLLLQAVNMPGKIGEMFGSKSLNLPGAKAGIAALTLLLEAGGKATEGYIRQGRQIDIASEKFQSYVKSARNAALASDLSLAPLPKTTGGGRAPDAAAAAVSEAGAATSTKTPQWVIDINASLDQTLLKIGFLEEEFNKVAEAGNLIASIQNSTLTAYERQFNAIQANKDLLAEAATLGVDVSAEQAILDGQSHQLKMDQATAFSDKWIGAMVTMSDVTRATIGAAISGVANTLADEIVDGTADWENLNKSIQKTFVAMIIQMTAMAVISSIIRAAWAAITYGTSEAGGALGGVLGALVGKEGGIVPGGLEYKKIPSFATGGYLGGVSDNQAIPIMAHGNEMVVNAPGTRRNRGVLDAINAGATIGSSGISLGDKGDDLRGGNVTNISISLSAFDATDLESAVIDRIVPIIENLGDRHATRINVSA